MKKTFIGVSIVIVLLTVGPVVLPALVSAADAGWFGLINFLPSITTVSPMGVQNGSATFTLTVNGTNFVSNSVVRWNSADRTTTYVSPDRLTATILASDVAVVGTASVTVSSPAPGGGVSNAVTVTINTKTNTTTTIVSDLPDPSQIGQSVTAAYTVTGSGGTPTGTVTVTDGSATCSAPVAAGSCTLTLTVVGKRTLTATYSGDTTFNDSSGSAAHVVFGPEYFPWVSKGPTPTPTPTRTPTPIPNPIRNGGFESPNSVNGPWLSAKCLYPCGGPWEGLDTRADSGELSTYGAYPHAGSWVAFLGGLLETEMRMDQETVTVPAGGSTLRYWIWIQSGETTCNIDQLDGAWVWFNANQIDAYALCTANATTGWVKRDVNLAAYAGQTGTLTFYARIWGNNSYWFIDDVAMGTLSGAQFIPYRR